MLSTSAKRLMWLGFLVTLVAALAVFTTAGFAQDPSQNSAKAPDTQPTPAEPQNQLQSQTDQHLDLNHPEKYIDQQVTLHGDVDHIYSSSAFVIEAKDEGKDHMLVISVSPDARPQGQMKEGEPVTAMGTIRTLDRAALEREYGSIDWGTTPFDKFDGKPILVMGVQKTAAVQLPQEPAPIEREKPTVTEPVTPAPEPVAPEPEPQRNVTEQAPAPAPSTPSTQSAPSTTENLPRTASPIPLFGLSGLFSLAAGLGARFLRRARG